ncbi:ATP-binding cassette domain-containing protein [Plantactinospora sp. KLBMP9567]|uniref:ATP-binding cassette domain-containing protein n=1 Tax=Plantactinospora sp. KLBMP9567 TaxID=3085900 RepID=UPI002981775D|nr:ATP-binding cassette domain-containing protein [Plantactinospora sp. KLBMP9567]MDW5325327.1 hypothetical protein [Plantactinospora sp. KLBMP9567]
MQREQWPSHPARRAPEYGSGSPPRSPKAGLAERGRAWPAGLSGGPARRAAFARALVREPVLMLLDEPFGALDALTRLKMQTLFGRLHAEHRFAALLVTHDVDEALLLADRILIVDDGRIVEDAPVPLSRPRAPGPSRLRSAAPAPARPARRTPGPGRRRGDLTGRCPPCRPVIVSRTAARSGMPDRPPRPRRARACPDR